MARTWRGARPVAERAAVDELGDEILAIVDLAGIVDREDVRMIQGRATWASRWNRRRASASASVAGRNLIAT